MLFNFSTMQKNQCMLNKKKQKNYKQGSCTKN